MVDVFLVDNDFAVSTLNELLLQFIQRTLVVNSIDLGSRNHTIAHFGIGEVQGVLEYFHLVFNIIVALGIVDTRLYEIVQIYFRKGSVVSFLVSLDAEDTQKKPCQQG